MPTPNPFRATKPQVASPSFRNTPKLQQGVGGGDVPYVVPYPVYVEPAPYVVTPDVQTEGEPEDAGMAPEQWNPLFPALIVPQPQAAPGPLRQPPAYMSSPEPRRDFTSEQPDRAAIPFFFIALKDRSVHTGVVYWLQGETLHYITAQGSRNQVSLQLVDRVASAKLNANAPLKLILPTR